MEKKENKEKNFNYMCYKFSKDLVELINNSGLPIYAVYFLLKDYFKEVSDLKDQQSLSFMQEEQKIEEKEIVVPIVEEEKEEE